MAVSRWGQYRGSTRAWIVALATLSLLSGVVQALVLKWQNRLKTKICSFDAAGGLVCGPPHHFTQAFLQTFVMFLGECLAIPFIAVSLCQGRAARAAATAAAAGDVEMVPAPDSEQDLESPQTQDAAAAAASGFELDSTTVWMWATAAPLDFVECALGCIAVTITYASTVQMLHNFMVICSALFTVLIMRYPLKVHEWLGCVVVTIALILCGIPAVQKPETATEMHHEMHWLGILLALVSTAVHSLQNIWEEKLFQKCPIAPQQAIAVEGLAGAVVSGLALPVVQYVGYENPVRGMRQIMNSSRLAWGTGIYALASFTNNLTGIAVTQLANGLLRCLFMSIRPPLVWAVEMYLAWNSFDWCNFAAMFVLALGLYIYLLLPPLDVLMFSRTTLLRPVTCGLTNWWLAPPADAPLHKPEPELPTPATIPE